MSTSSWAIFRHVPRILAYGKGRPGHPPYAVPASYIVGVVTHIYWPPERCRALR